MSIHAQPLASLEWAQVDVFADAPYEGNMLAIFPDATGLTDAQMQALARETNLSETAFVFPRDIATECAEGVRVRIFTTQEELPFAGHPTLGTASWLRLHRPECVAATSLVLHLNAGPVEVHFPEEDASHRGVIAEMLQPDPSFLANISSEDVAAVLGVSVSRMHTSLTPAVVTTGLPFLVAPLVSLEALAAVEPQLPQLHALLFGYGAKFVYCIAQAAADIWHARMPFYGGEDPATGSAAGCAISYLVANDAAASDQPVTILQGQHIRRPSRICVQASCKGDRVHGVRVRGCTIPVAAGRFFRP